jgi:hypothetical protein
MYLVGALCRNRHLKFAHSIVGHVSIAFWSRALEQTVYIGLAGNLEIKCICDLQFLFWNAILKPHTIHFFIWLPGIMQVPDSRSPLVMHEQDYFLGLSIPKEEVEGFECQR